MSQMRNGLNWKLPAAAVVAAALFAGGVLVGQSTKQPASVMHVVTLYWKADATDAQKQAALDGAVKLAQSDPGIRNVWVKTLHKQGAIGEHAVEAAIAMEFESQQALHKYSGSEAQKQWYRVYMPARGESRTFDITN